MTEHQHHAHHDHHYSHPRPFLKEIEKLGDEYLIRKAPYHLPHKRKEIIAKILPVLALIVALLALPSLLGAALYLLGIAGHSAAGRGLYGVWGNVYIVILIQTLLTATVAVLYFKSFDPLRKRQYIGWACMFYAGLVGFAANLLDGGVIGAIIGFIVSMYLLFQVKELYH